MARVCVIDDQALIRDSLEATLTQQDHKVCAFNNAQDGLAAMRQRSFDVVLTDLRMPGMDGVALLREMRRLGIDVPREWIESIDVLMVLDTAAWAQLGDMCEVIRTTKATKMVLDHHLSSDDLGAELFKDTAAEATGRLVIEAAEQLGVEITPEVARALFAAVATDTGWFRFASTSAGTYQLAAQLTAAGAQRREFEGEQRWLLRNLKQKPC